MSLFSTLIMQSHRQMTMRLSYWTTPSVQGGKRTENWLTACWSLQKLIWISYLSYWSSNFAFPQQIWMESTGFFSSVRNYGGTKLYCRKNKLEIDLLFPVLFISLTEDLSFEIHSRSPARACKIRMKKDEESNPIFLEQKHDR